MQLEHTCIVSGFDLMSLLFFIEIWSFECFERSVPEYLGVVLNDLIDVSLGVGADTN